jgi:hypothetical protein
MRSPKCTNAALAGPIFVMEVLIGFGCHFIKDSLSKPVRPASQLTQS